MEEKERAETQRKHFRKTNQENILIPTHLQSHWVLARNFIDITLYIIETSTQHLKQSSSVEISP